MGPPGNYAESSRMAMMDVPAMAQGAMRPRAQTDPDGMDRNKERQLVGSLTNSYKFKQGGLVKKVCVYSDQLCDWPEGKLQITPGNVI